MFRMLWRPRCKVQSEKSSQGAVSIVGRCLERHTIHAYFNTSPESPDGSKVLYYISVDPEGHVGEVVTIDRRTGDERVLAKDVETEDAHRVARQQWCDGGRSIVYHDHRDGAWSVVAVDAASGDARTVALDRQVSWGSPALPIVPLYGYHWDSKGFKDLELIWTDSGCRETVFRPGDGGSIRRLDRTIFWDDRCFDLLPYPESGRATRDLQAGGCGEWRLSEQGGEPSRRTIHL